MQRQAQFSAEMIGCGTELSHRCRCGCTPFSRDIVNGCKLAVALHREKAQLVVGGMENVFGAVVHRLVLEPLHGHLHVALSGTQPHFAHKNVVEHGLLAIVEGDGIRTACNRGADGRLPTSIGIGLCGIALVVPRGSNLDFARCLGLTPKVGVGFSLYDHAVGEYLRQGYFGADACGGKQGSKDKRCFFHISMMF